MTGSQWTTTGHRARPSIEHSARNVMDAAIRAVKRALDDAGIEMPADIIALQATPSLRAAISGEAEVTPGGGVRTR